MLSGPLLQLILDLKWTAVNYQKYDVARITIPEKNSKEDLFGQIVIHDSFIDKTHQFLSSESL